MNKIATVSANGQITIPKKLREKYKTTYFRIEDQGDHIAFIPTKTYEEFLQELDDIAEDYDKNGGYDFEEVMEASHK